MRIVISFDERLRLLEELMLKGSPQRKGQHLPPPPVTNQGKVPATLTSPSCDGLTDSTFSESIKMLTSQLEKKLRALRKKLKAIEDLEAKAASGAELEGGQKAKIAAKGELKAEIVKYESFSNDEEVRAEFSRPTHSAPTIHLPSSPGLSLISHACSRRRRARS